MEKKQNLTQQKHAFTNQKKCTTAQNKHKKLQPGLVTSYDIRPGNGERLFWFWRCINLSLTYLLRHLPTYLQPSDPHRTQISDIIHLSYTHAYISHTQQFNCHFPGECESCPRSWGLSGITLLYGWTPFLMLTRGITHWTILSSRTGSRHNTIYFIDSLMPDKKSKKDSKTETAQLRRVMKLIRQMHPTHASTCVNRRSLSGKISDMRIMTHDFPLEAIISRTDYNQYTSMTSVLLNQQPKAWMANFFD